MKKETHIYELVRLDYLKQLNHQQKEELDHWLQESPDHATEYTDILKVLSYSDSLVAMNQIDTTRDLIYLKQKMKPGGQLQKLYFHFQKIAAILIIPLLLVSLWTVLDLPGPGQHEYAINSTETIFGVRSQIHLSDGTKVWLNSGSKLFYPEKFNGKIREVKLLGEAYFQVESDQKHPFYVDLGGYKIKATGTSFNISNYDDEDEIMTYLEHGKVSLVESVKGKEIQHGQLKEGEIIRLDKKEKKYRVQLVDGSKYLSWINGKLIFKNDDIQDVAVRLGRWFNVEVIIDDERLKEYVFTATFEEENLEETLNLLAHSSPIKYKIVPGRQLDDSSYSKRKIIISKKENE